MASDSKTERRRNPPVQAVGNNNPGNFRDFRSDLSRHQETHMKIILHKCNDSFDRAEQITVIRVIAFFPFSMTVISGDENIAVMHENQRLEILEAGNIDPQFPQFFRIAEIDSGAVPRILLGYDGDSRAGARFECFRQFLCRGVYATPDPGVIKMIRENDLITAFPFLRQHQFPCGQSRKKKQNGQQTNQFHENSFLLFEFSDTPLFAGQFIEI